MTKERMQLLRQIQNHLIRSIFIDKERALVKALMLVAQENQKLLNCWNATFLFNGHMCPHINGLYAPDVNKELHPSLREKVANIFNTIDYDDRDIRAGMQALIANALAIVRDISDVYTLLPPQLRSQVPVVDPNIFNIGPLLTDEEIVAFKEANKTNMAYFKRMLATRLLLQEPI